MQYDEFRDRWLTALQEAGFAFFHSSPRACRPHACTEARRAPQPSF